MELLDCEIVLKKSDQPIYLHCFSDIHRSAVGCDTKKLHQDIAALLEGEQRGEIHRWFGGGDFCNSVGAKDKRYDHTQVRKEFAEYSGDDLFQHETRVLAQEFAPIKHLCLGLGTGNHERSVAKYNDYNAIVGLCERLDVPYLGYSALMRVKLIWKERSSACLIYWHHGVGAARTKGSKARSMESFRDVVTNADVYFSGHTHEWMNFPSVRMEGTREGVLRLIQREVMFVNSGTYLKAYPTTKTAQRGGKFDQQRAVHVDYAEMAGYLPNIIGHNGVTLTMIHSGNTSKLPTNRIAVRQFTTW